MQIVEDRDGAPYPPVAIEVVGNHAVALAQGMRDDVMAEVGVWPSVAAEVVLILLQQGHERVPLEDVDAHGGLKGVLGRGVL